MVDGRTSQHYTWSSGCDGWHFVQTVALSVIEEDAAGHFRGPALSPDGESVLLRAARPSIDRSRRKRTGVEPWSGRPHHRGWTSSGSQSG